MSPSVSPSLLPSLDAPGSLSSRQLEALGRFSRGQPTLLDRIALDPTVIFTRAEMTPDPWQERLLHSTSNRILELCSRQAGKSVVAAAKALQVILLNDEALVLILSPSQEQSKEFFKAKFLRLWNALGRPLAVKPANVFDLELSNGSRIMALPQNEETVRCYSDVALLVLDEASRISDDLYDAVTPMLAASQGSIIGLSTPFGKRGWFWREWEGRDADGMAMATSLENWDRYGVTADMVPRFTPAFLASELARKGRRKFQQEYYLEFVEADDAVFRQEDIDRLVKEDLKPLFEDI